MADIEKVIKVSTEGVKESTKEIDKLGETMEDTSKETDGLGDSMLETSEATGLFSGTLGLLGKGMKALKAGFLVVKAGLISVRNGIIATGVGALIVAFGSLILFFTKTEKGAKLLERATAILGVAFDKLVDLLSGLGEGLIDIFSNPLESLKTLGKFLQQNIINRFKAFSVLGESIVKLFKGDFKGAIKGATDGFVQLGTGITDATDKVNKFGKDAVDSITNVIVETDKLTLRTQALRDSERDLAVETSLRRAEIDKLIASSRDQSLTEEERLANLEKASKLEDELLAKEIANAEESLALVKAKNAQAESLEEDRQAEADAQIRLNELLAKSALKQADIQVKANNLAVTSNKKKKAQEEADRKKEEADAKKKEEEDKAKKKKEEEEEKIARDKRVAEFDLQKDLEIQKAIEKKASLDELEQLQFEADLEKLEIRRDEGLISQEEFNLKELELRNKHNDNLTKSDEKRVKDEEDLEVKIAKVKEDVRQTNIDSVTKGFALLASLDEKNKALQAASLIADSVVSISKIIASTQVAIGAATAVYAPLGAAGVLPLAQAIASYKISAGIGIASTAVATAKGLSALKKGGSVPTGGVGGAISSSSPSTPSAPPTPPTIEDIGSGETEGSELITSGGPGSIQVDVSISESEITNTQNSVSEIERRSKIG